MNRMIASTMRPGAVTLAPRPMAPLLTASTTPPPAPTRTREERPQDLREQPPPFMPRVIEVALDELEFRQSPAELPQLGPDAAGPAFESFGHVDPPLGCGHSTNLTAAACRRHHPNRIKKALLTDPWVP